MYLGGGPYNQIRGTTLGTLIVGIGLLLTGNAAFDNFTVIIVGLISGALWAFGQGNQLKSVNLIGVSKLCQSLQVCNLLVQPCLVLFSWENGAQWFKLSWA